MSDIHPIDIVYTWVNNRDENWLNKFKQNQGDNSDSKAIHNCGYHDNDELKYALRSLEKFAPWINHVYIVTDNQYPEWINLHHDKLTIIDHSAIIPHNALPTFNSHTIEFFLCNIPNLSEYFLYANDDTYFGRGVSSDFFYTSKGEPICRFGKEIHKLPQSLWKQNLLNSVQCLRKHHYNCPVLTPHHNIDAYKKSLINKFMEEFKDDVQETILNKFRTDRDIERNIFALFAVTIGKGIKKKVYLYDNKKPKYKKIIQYLLKGSANDSAIFLYNNTNIEEEFNKYAPALFCINDDTNVTEEDRKNGKLFLEKLFPNKSSFEK